MYNANNARIMLRVKKFWIILTLDELFEGEHNIIMSCLIVPAERGEQWFEWYLHNIGAKKFKWETVCIFQTTRLMHSVLIPKAVT